MSRVNKGSWFKPQRYVFARSKPDWMKLPDGVDVYDAMAAAPKD